MVTPPEISVLIDTYQQGRFVARVVESVLAQTHPPAEIVVVDDGSADATGQELATFGDRIRVITQSNQGQAGALNTGLAAVARPWVAFLRISADGWIQVALQLRAREMSLLPERTVRLRVHAENRWTDRDELDVALLGQRRALYEKLAGAARTLASSGQIDGDRAAAGRTS